MLMPNATGLYEAHAHLLTRVGFGDDYEVLIESQKYEILSCHVSDNLAFPDGQDRYQRDTIVVLGLPKEALMIQLDHREVISDQPDMPLYRSVWFVSIQMACDFNPQRDEAFRSPEPYSELAFDFFRDALINAGFITLPLYLDSGTLFIRANLARTDNEAISLTEVLARMEPFVNLAQPHLLPTFRQMIVSNWGPPAFMAMAQQAFWKTVNIPRLQARAEKVLGIPALVR